MTKARVATPSDATIRVVVRLGLVWAALGLLVQVIFAAAIAPRLGETFDFTIPGRGPTLAVPVDTTVMSIVGLVVTVAGLLAGVGAVISSLTNGRSSYAVAAVVSVVIPGFVALLTANGVAALAAGRDPSIGVSLLVGFVAIAAVCGGAISVLAVPTWVAKHVEQQG